jgi:type IV secretion system protein TrbL
VLLNGTTIFNPQDAIVSGMCAIAILICFGLMAANMIEALVESYVVISAGVLMMGFGGSSWTSEYAKKLLIYAISVGAKLFLLQLLMGLCEQLVSQLATEFNGANLNDALVMVGVAVIMWIITLNVPNKLQGLINGTSFGSGGMIAGAVTAAAQAGVAAGVAVASGGFGAATGATSIWKGASALAQAQNPEKPATFRAAAGNTIRAGFENAGERMRGEIRHGNPAMQMGHAMRQKSEKLNEQREAADTAPGGKAHYYSSVPADQKQYENMGANGSKNRIYPEED